jgi:hypothetical protein
MTPKDQTMTRIGSKIFYQVEMCTFVHFKMKLKFWGFFLKLRNINFDILVLFNQFISANHNFKKLCRYYDGGIFRIEIFYIYKFLHSSVKNKIPKRNPARIQKNLCVFYEIFKLRKKTFYTKEHSRNNSLEIQSY